MVLLVVVLLLPLLALGIDGVVLVMYSNVFKNTIKRISQAVALRLYNNMPFYLSCI